MAIQLREPVIGIVYLRPGHVHPLFTIDSIKVVMAGDYQVNPPFVVVAKRTGDHVGVRIRHLGP